VIELEMEHNEGSIRKRVADLWRWQNSKSLLIGALGITAIISMFEIRLDPLAMLREVASNFITCASITFITATLTSAFGLFRLGGSWKRKALFIVVLAVGGVIGGLASWGINYTLFDIYISHPHIYILVTGSLAVIFGLAFLAYLTVQEKLDETARRLAEKEVQEQTLLRLKTEAELEALRARVNPHFLFNTLNSIASLIPVDPVRAEAVVQRMSNLFRYILAASDRGMVPLNEELDIVEEYLEIEKVRLGDRLVYTIDRGDGLDGVEIPGVLLQPLVENSVKYGIVPLARGGEVRVRCRRNSGSCIIEIADNGGGFDAETAPEGFGIGGVRQRLELNYPGEHQFDISTDGGVKIQITIPAGR
jgi:sensor histidine kinase YesM